jgi:hypothetical protein
MDNRKKEQKPKKRKEKQSLKHGVGELVTTHSAISYSTRLKLPVIMNANPTFSIRMQTGASAIALTAGVCAQTVNVSAALVNNFTTRWGVTFREYCITSVEATIDPCGANTGLLWCILDELDSTAPTLASSSRLNRVEVKLNNSSSEVGVIKWRIAELNDAGYTLATSTSPVPFYLKFYTDTTLGTNSGTTATVAILNLHVTFSFRGII